MPRKKIASSGPVEPVPSFKYSPDELVQELKYQKKHKHGSQIVKFNRRNWDSDFFYDLSQGDAFIITEPGEITLDGTKQKSLYGPQSPLYGTNYEDEQSFIERYRCQCGAFKSRLFEGEICPICETKVEYRDSNINITGWISLGDNRIISPLYFQLFCNAIGRQIFPDIIFARYKITTDGKRERPEEGDLDEEMSSPFAGIGVDAFHYRYEEILDYFAAQKKNKKHTFDVLKQQKRNAFVSHIPIPSTMLRPQSITSDTFYYQSIDKLINTTFSLSENLKSCDNVERDYIIHRLQVKVNEMWNLYFNELNGKTGFIRDKILGGSINFTSRNVIIPDPSLHDDEVDLSYNTFLEVFKYKIIHYLMLLDDISLAKAYAIWKDASIYNQKVRDIMQFIVDRGEVRALINRNPTLNYYSMLEMRIRTIKPDGDNFALSVPLSILPGLNADFDGDILNIIAILDPAIAYMFRKFNPIKRMIISRDNGMINDYFSIQKGQLIDLNYFATMNAMENDQPETYAVKNKNGEIIYLTEEEIKKNNLKKIPTTKLPVEVMTTMDFPVSY